MSAIPSLVSTAPRNMIAMLIAALLCFGTGTAMANERFLTVQIPHWAQDRMDGEDPREAIQPGARIVPPAVNEIADDIRDRPSTTPLKPMTPRDYEALLAQMLSTPGDTAPLSPLEDHYSKRADHTLQQFGYDFFIRAAPPPVTATPPATKTDNTVEPRNIPTGAVQDNFILNIGDRLNVLLRGQRNHQAVYTVTGDGLLVIEDLPPLSAAGRSMGEVRAALEAAAGDLHNTDIFVSLESVQQIGVLIVGHVHQPGRQNLTVFHTVPDALIQAGGVQKTGSLRQIKLIRDGRARMIDLYDLLNHGHTAMDIGLRDGDRLVVPTIGPTMAVGGDVKRPGIYEILPVLKSSGRDLSPGGEILSLQKALDLGGGVLSPGHNRFIKLAMFGDGREIVEDITDPLTPSLGEGSILMVARATEKRSETVELSGNTRQRGVHALSRAGTLSALLSDTKVFGPDIYPLLGVIERTDKATLSKQLIDFPPQQVTAGYYDRKLQDGDKILLFSRQDMMTLQETVKKKKKSKDQKTGEAEENPLNDPALRAFLQERSVFVRGAVRDSGLWPVAEGATLATLIAAAGGFSIEADTANIEVTSNASDTTPARRLKIDYHNSEPDNIAIAPGDAIRINQKPRKALGQTVMILGEVHHPGKYDLLPGDTLGKLIERAGQITEQAYPDGAIFSREAERKAEESRFRAAAQELERAVAAATQKAKNPPDATQIAMAHDLANELRNVEAVGRITVEANPGILKTHPELDILLEPGDRIYIPRRPLTVRVHGEVQSPASLQFRSTKSPSDYISEAGGSTYYADRSRAFVLYPDGSAQPLQVSAWNHKATMIPPGSTIVVPRDPKPFSFMETAKDFSQILSNLAITGIFLRDLQDDE